MIVEYSRPCKGHRKEATADCREPHKWDRGSVWTIFSTLKVDLQRERLLRSMLVMLPVSPPPHHSSSFKVTPSKLKKMANFLQLLLLLFSRDDSRHQPLKSKAPVTGLTDFHCMETGFLWVFPSCDWKLLHPPCRMIEKCSSWVGNLQLLQKSQVC